MRINVNFCPLLSVTLCLAMLNGCASGQAQQEPRGKFEQTIKAGDIRLFSYSQPLFREVPRPITSLNRREEGTGKPKEDAESQLKRTLHDLEQDPRLNTYCPEGYVLIDKYAVLNEVVIRGECRYSAKSKEK